MHPEQNGVTFCAIAGNFFAWRTTEMCARIQNDTENDIESITGLSSRDEQF